MKNFKKLFFLLTPHERKHVVLLIVLITIMALIDAIGVASILPFMAVLSNPKIIETNSLLKELFQFSNYFGVDNDQEFLFALGVVVFIILVFSLIFKAITSYVQLRFIFMREYSLGKRLVSKYLHQPYYWFLNRNSSELGKNILSEVSQVIGGGLRPIINLITQSMIIISLIALLIISNPKLALIAGFTIGLAYGIIFFLIKKYLNKIGIIRANTNKLRFFSISEAFAASKEIKVGGLEQVYIDKFSNSAQIFARTQANSNIIAQLPRFFLEAIAFGGIILIILYMMAQSTNFNNSLPLISLYVFVGYRLMPAVQQIYASISQITFMSPSIDKIYNDVKNLKQPAIKENKEVLRFEKKIVLKNINFNYPKSLRTALRDINLNISAKSTIGLVGATGSGKTTTVDVILGLLNYQSGTLEVDGKIINEQNVRSWQRLIGYVPQHIYLSDDTIEANIAFGVNHNNINYDNVVNASKIANLHDFVISELPEKYKTIVGERGIRLSGGQRQRIGIARALYHKPSVLIFDEATSALDNQTEKSVMEAVNNLRNDITIIIIAHRLTTVKKCDKIFIMEKGKIMNEGTFEELVKGDDIFRMNAN